MIAGELIPWGVREAVRAGLAFPRRMEAGRAFQKIRAATRNRTRVGFGGVLDDGRPIHGGAVKLLPLREAFGGDEREFNILYSVSSSQPEFAEDLFRVCRRQGIRVVWNQNGVGFPAWAGKESERFNGPMRRLAGMADFIIFQSEFCRRSAGRWLGDFPGIASQVLFNPVDLVRFQPAPGVVAKPRLLAAGTHGTRDRVLPLLRALRDLRARGFDVELTVAGRFQWKNGEADFRETVRRLRLDRFVRRIERFSQADAPELYRAHSVLVHPKYMDPCPTVVIEALACGLPVVGSATGGMPELVPGTCGVLVPGPENYEVSHAPTATELSDAIEHVLEAREAMAVSAREWAVDRFDVQKWIAEHRAIFESVLG
ncbi:MAG: glycosyltransferase family 4 protein [Terrimicrobiaceae bacterium]|nr:glycosyltransferase family 4 protein [Terrimicrobiaceae bacterium]